MASKYDATFPPIGKIASTPLLHAASRPDPIAAAATHPSYADMAGRQPPANRHNSSGFNFNREPQRDRINDRFRHDGRGLGPSRGRGDHGGLGRGRGDDHGHGRGNGRGGPGHGPTAPQRETQQQQRYQPIAGPPRHNIGADAAESSLQGAVRNQQHQQPQPTESGMAKKKRPYCWRCKCSGHSNEECRADLDCIICNKKNSHLSWKCPILKMSTICYFYWL